MRDGSIHPHSLNSAVDGGKWSAPHPVHFEPGEKDPSIPDGTQSWSGPHGTEEKSLPLPGIKPIIHLTA
jgi:hypothetical protein